MKSLLLLIHCIFFLNFFAKPPQDDQSDKTKITTMIRNAKFNPYKLKDIKIFLFEYTPFFPITLFHEAICQNAWNVCDLCLNYFQKNYLTKMNLRSTHALIDPKTFLHSLIRQKAPDFLIKKYVNLIPKSVSIRDETINKALPIEVAIMQQESIHLIASLIPEHENLTLIALFATQLNQHQIADFLYKEHEKKKKKAGVNTPFSQTPIPTLKRSSQSSTSNPNQQSKRSHLEQ